MLCHWPWTACCCCLSPWWAQCIDVWSVVRGADAQEMLCIEPAVAGSGPVTLAPGAAWSGKQVLTYKLP